MSAEHDEDILDLVHNLGALGRSCQAAGSAWADRGALRPQVHNSSPFSPQPLGIHNRIPQRNSKVFAAGGTPQSTNRRIQPVSVPRKPPDLQNAALFPSIGESLVDNGVPDRRQSFPPTASDYNARNICGMSPQDRKLKKLENKFTVNSSTSSSINSTGFGTPSPAPVATSKVKPRKYASVSTITVHKSPPSENKTIVKESPARKTPRSAELFSELTPEVIEEVDKLAQQYSSILDNNVCCSVLDEITLLLRLVASGSGGLGNSKLNQKLSTLAQQVYFVIKVLSLQLNSSLSSVDPSIIQILIQKYPHRIPKPVRKHFESWVSEQLRLKSESQLAELAKSPPSITSKPSEFHNCVTFRSETDGRANFPSQGDFHSFCKQRDLFYTIKNSWNGRAAGPAFVSASSREPDSLYSKIKALFHLNSSWANLSHLAALFTSQFILDTIEDLQKKEQEGNRLGNCKDEQMRSMIESNPDKFAKLRDRMSMGTASESLKECLSFSKYFLGVASSPAFNQHLSDRLSYEISQIETFLENSVNVSPKETITLLRKTVLYSQLLGYVTFLPYNGGALSHHGGPPTTVEKEALLSSQAQLRSHQQPPLDLESMLNAAICQRRLTFTMPWVIEFLLAADTVSLQLPSYKRVIKLIYTIYRSYLTISSKNKIVSLRNRNFLRFWCGKLLSSPKIAKSLEFDKPSKVLMKNTPSLFDEEFLDSCATVGESLAEVYFATEFQDMKSILHEGLEQQQQCAEKGLTASTIEPKHIRPIPADNKKNPEQAKQVQLQRQLESSFFDSNPPSVKKTVDFISERLASNYVKKLRGLVSQIRCDLAVDDKFELEAARECKNRMLSGLEEFCKVKCNDLVAVLIGESSISPPGLSICEGITYRHCCEKVSEWVENHIKSEMFPVIPSDDIAVMKKKQTEGISNANKKPSDESSPACEETFSSMILLHRTLKKVHKKKTVTGEEIDSILFSTAIESCCSQVSSTLVDFGVSLIAFVPELVTCERQERLIFLWKKSWNAEYKILCARNLLLIQDSCKPEGLQRHETWKVLTGVVSQLVKGDIITVEGLEQDCLRLLREDWDPTVISEVSTLLRKVMDSPNKSTYSAAASSEVIDWISWVISDEKSEEF